MLCEEALLNSQPTTLSLGPNAEVIDSFFLWFLSLLNTMTSVMMLTGTFNQHSVAFLLNHLFTSLYAEHHCHIFFGTCHMKSDHTKLP